MEITEHTFRLRELGAWSGLDYAKLSEPVVRAPGLHVSDVLDALERTMPGLKKQRERVIAPDRMHAYREVGFMWEEFLQTSWRRRRGAEAGQRSGLVLQPRFVYSLGKGRVLHGSGDGLDFNRKITTLEEYKTTFKTQRRMNDYAIEFWRWRIQQCVYLYGVWAPTATTFTNRLSHRLSRHPNHGYPVRLLVLWMQGDYRGDSPIPTSYLIKYTWDEILEAWRMVKRQAIRMLERGRER